jgi:TRAP-type transport system periplasmic protein
MPIARRTLLASTMAAVAAPAVVRLAAADAPQFRFKLHHSFSSVSSAHDGFLVPWARQVEAQSGGRIQIDVFPAMQLGGAPAQLYDQARDGVADFVWASPRQTPGRFPKIELFELPFVPSRRALVSSNAIEDYARSNLLDEFTEVHPVCFSCSDRGVVHSSRPIYTVGDIRGLRMHVQTRFAADAMHALGARPVPMPSAQLPLAITQHVVDGCVDPWDMVPALKLADLLKAHTEFAESSLSTTTFVLAMNRAAYDRLPRDLKTVIDNNSGQHAAGMAGAMWDLKAAAVADTVSRAGDAVISLLPEAVAHWRTATAPVIEAWLKQMRERKVDGGKLLDSARASLAKYVDEPEPQPPQPPQPAQPSQPPAEAKVGASAKAPSGSAAPASPAASPAAAPAPTLSVATPAPVGQTPAPPAQSVPWWQFWKSAPASPPHPAPAAPVASATPPMPPTPALSPTPSALPPQPVPSPLPAAPPAPPPGPAIVTPAPVPPPKTLNIPI